MVSKRGKKPDFLLVTGVPRSGTTFVGHVLSQPIQTSILIEPFNPSTGMDDFPVAFPFARSRADIDHLGIMPWIEKAGDFNYVAPRRYVKDTGRLRSFAKLVLGNRASWSHHVARFNPISNLAIIKDPTASLMSAFLADHFDAHIVFMVRHPVSGFHSFDRLSWWAEGHLKLLLSQDACRAFVRESFPRFDVCKPRVPAESYAWFWNIVNQYYLSELVASERCTLVTHESLSSAPHDAFTRIASAAGLTLSSRQKRLITRRTQGTKLSATGGIAHDMVRNSSTIFSNSVAQVDKSDRDKIIEVTAPVYAKMYGGAGVADYLGTAKENEVG
ncbi:MAG: sulfotransferase [Pseudomonadota bacterium]